MKALCLLLALLSSLMLPASAADVAPLREAISLARYTGVDGRVHTLAVLEDDGQAVSGVDLSLLLNRYDAYSLDVLVGYSHDDLTRRIEAETTHVKRAYADLLPAVLGSHHPALGINYAEHGREARMTEPFLFPKMVATSAAVHQLTYQPEWLLDYEVELGVVFDRTITATTPLDEARVGFLVVNDFTDRAYLMRHINTKNLGSGAGFSDAKSVPNFFPTGPYVVVPRQWRTFYQDLQLSLTVNGQARQQEKAANMVWKLDKIVAEVVATQGEKRWESHGQPTSLYDGAGIPKGAVLLTGTPSGVAFRAPGGGFIAGAITKSLFTFSWLRGQSPIAYMKESYIKAQRHKPAYLKPGDVVVTSVSKLGHITTTIQPAAASASASQAQRP
ncbi:fumarylacetoacetate hydrolase family protein [Hymenobacter sp. YC55]|uniref:fumarylacetoacetate hydrolase family protein n=1 Tax=Hymenobacter sp. YC55 TaxID=3034019 RepID=UPI0023F7AA7B|nr:fumarylacetoacetate hydrolase family protein [Hymenobacter sp. YC55]MDF7814099.1 fumarylacetoacetate hydrolase family protein [Hymenobacter sp. YC55]